MTQDEADRLFNTLLDGQEIMVQVASGRTFTGIYDGASSDPAVALHFETFEGNALRAEWANITAVSPRGGRTGVSGAPLMVPPEHPYSQQRGAARVPYTTRNPRGMS